MPSDAAIAAPEDILRNIDLANRFVAGLDRDAFLKDERTIYAVTRCLEIISEASRRLSAETKTRNPSIEWSRMAQPEMSIVTITRTLSRRLSGTRSGSHCRRCEKLSRLN